VLRASLLGPFSGNPPWPPANPTRRAGAGGGLVGGEGEQVRGQRGPLGQRGASLGQAGSLVQGQDVTVPVGQRRNADAVEGTRNPAKPETRFAVSWCPMPPCGKEMLSKSICSSTLPRRGCPFCLVGLCYT